jgi:DNA topoisomerase-1
MKSMSTKQSNTLYTGIQSNPSEALKTFNLVYVSGSDLSIIREKLKGNFVYLKGKKKIQKKKDLTRIQDLVIPPAWEDVRISHLENGHLQATG